MTGSSSGPIGWGGTLAEFRTSQSPARHHLDCARSWTVRGAGI